MKKVCYQNHHPDREKHPDWTIKLRRWQHLMVRRMEQYKATPENLVEMENVVTAVTYIRDRIKKALR